MPSCASLEEALRLGPGVLGGIEQEAIEAQAGLVLDEACQCDRFAGRLDAGALAPRIALDDDAERTPSDFSGTRQALDHRRVVCSHRDRCPPEQATQAAHLLLAQQVVADEDVRAQAA
jgi:hypothetical protein